MNVHDAIITGIGEELGPRLPHPYYLTQEHVQGILCMRGPAPPGSEWDFQQLTIGCTGFTFAIKVWPAADCLVWAFEPHRLCYYLFPPRYKDQSGLYGLPNNYHTFRYEDPQTLDLLLEELLWCCTEHWANRKKFQELLNTRNPCSEVFLDDARATTLLHDRNCKHARTRSVSVVEHFTRVLPSLNPRP